MSNSTSLYIILSLINSNFKSLNQLKNSALSLAQTTAPCCALPSLQGGRAASELKPVIATDLAPAGKPAVNYMAM